MPAAAREGILQVENADFITFMASRYLKCFSPYITSLHTQTNKTNTRHDQQQDSIQDLSDVAGFVMGDVYVFAVFRPCLVLSAGELLRNGPGMFRVSGVKLSQQPSISQDPTDSMMHPSRQVLAAAHRVEAGSKHYKRARTQQLHSQQPSQHAASQPWQLQDTQYDCDDTGSDNYA